MRYPVVTFYCTQLTLVCGQEETKTVWCIEIQDQICSGPFCPNWLDIYASSSNHKMLRTNCENLLLTGISKFMYNVMGYLLLHELCKFCVADW